MKIFAKSYCLILILFCNFIDLLRPVNLYPETLKLDSSYLNRVPHSEYILGSGDLLNIIILRDIIHQD